MANISNTEENINIEKEGCEMNKLVLTYIGMDSWSRPVYKNEDGKLFKDVDARKHRTPEICTVYGGFDGEPDTPINYISKYKDLEIEFNPHRVTFR